MEYSGLLEVKTEIYSTTFWAADPKALLVEIANEYLKCDNPQRPFVLVYVFGGTLEGPPLLIKTVVPEIH
jgi:hypothetical protein